MSTDPPPFQPAPTPQERRQRRRSEGVRFIDDVLRSYTINAAVFFTLLELAACAFEARGGWLVFLIVGVAGLVAIGLSLRRDQSSARQWATAISTIVIELVATVIVIIGAR